MLIFASKSKRRGSNFPRRDPPAACGAEGKRGAHLLSSSSCSSSPRFIQPTWRLRNRGRAPRLEWWAACLRSCLPPRPKPRERPLPSHLPPSVRGDAPHLSGGDWRGRDVRDVRDVMSGRR